MLQGAAVPSGVQPLGDGTAVDKRMRRVCDGGLNAACLGKPKPALSMSFKYLRRRPRFWQGDPGSGLIRRDLPLLQV
jgi:hypothetical protein